jgi:DNA replication protein DnaC
MSEFERLGSIMPKVIPGQRLRIVDATLAESSVVVVPRNEQKEEVCPNCKGAGWLRQNVPCGHPEFGKPVKCVCKIKQQANDLFGGAHIPDDFNACSFESYQALPLDAVQKQVAMMVQVFVLERLGQYEGRKRGLYLYGLWGVGKTGLAVSALRMALDAGHSGLYLPTYELFDILYESIAASTRLTRGYGNEEDRQEESAGAKLLRLVDSVEWLVLDDLGVECGSRFVIGRLYRIIEGRRSRSGLYTIFTSNKDARGLDRHWRPDGAGSGAFDDCERIIQRIGEYCTPIHLVGRSLREKNGASGK